MELYWYIVVIIFIIIKIFFYVCWYRSRQRQLAAYLSNPRNAQIVIVGGRAYLHQMCERQNSSSVWPNWYGVQDEAVAGEPSSSPPTASFTALDMPPPYEAVSGADDLKPPPYSECSRSDETASAASPSHRPAPANHSEDCSEAPPPYTPSLAAASANQRGGPGASLNQSRPEDVPV